MIKFDPIVRCMNAGEYWGEPNRSKSFASTYIAYFYLCLIVNTNG